MTVKSAYFATADRADIHLVPGLKSAQLDQLLRIEHSSGQYSGNRPPRGVSVTLAPNFTPGPETAGVGVNTKGEVTVSGTPASPERLLNFLVIASVTDGTTATPFTDYIRVHIHESITRIWLTPARLTVRFGAPDMRFTVLAEFSDGTYGDISNWSPDLAPISSDRAYVRLAAKDDEPVLEWTTDSPGEIDVNPDTGWLDCRSYLAIAEIKATMKPKPAPVNLVAAGLADAGVGWADVSAPLTLVDGPGLAKMSEVRNILILPDGFKDTERTVFQSLVRQLVNQLNTNKLLRPFDLLKDRMNYFMAWVPSPEGGVSPLSQVFRSDPSGGIADAVQVYTSVVSTDIATAFTIDLPSTPTSNQYFLLNERNTAFHVVLGERPKARLDWFLREAYFNPHRFGDQDINDFLNNLEDDAGNPVGGTWASGGKDEALIVVLCRTNRNAGLNKTRAPSGKCICLSLESGQKHRIEQDASHHGLNLVPDQISSKPSPALWTTVAHECAHSFGLDDEYGGDFDVLPDSGPSYETAHNAPNVQPHVDLALPGSGLEAKYIKWRWPRIEKAGLLAMNTVNEGGGLFRLFLEHGHAATFAKGDIVRLRRRPLLPAYDRAGLPSDRFEVTEVEPSLNSLIINALPGSKTSDIVDDYPHGSIVMVPKRALDPDFENRQLGDDLELVHANTYDRINASRNPLNARASDPPNRACTVLPADDKSRWRPTPALNYIYPNGAPKRPLHSSWIVGLYEQGVRHDCGVYHPTGICLMRIRQYHDQRSSTISSYQFCPVCRYIMIDALDPSKHGDIDRDYEGRYPK